MGRFDTAGRAKRDVPALNTELPGQRFQFLRCGNAGTLEVFRIDCSARKIKLREADAAHTTAFHQFGFKIFANDQFGRTAADINNQLAAFFRLRMFNAHKNQARFFITRDDFDRVGNNLFCPFKKLRCVERTAQRVGPYNTHA